MSDKYDLARGWLVKGRSDLAAGNLVADGDRHIAAGPTARFPGSARR